MRWQIIILLCLKLLITTGYGQERYAVLITEFLSDPSPPRNLPNAEFIELTNVSNFPVNLLNWQIGDNSSTALIRTEFILMPGKQVIICPRTAEAEYSELGDALGITGFPSLNNDADHIIVYNESGKVIHAISYNTTWFKNPLKAEGGWSIEMINTNTPCLGIENYTASIDENGGTPGKINSVNNNNPDKLPPAITNAYFKTEKTLLINFSEPIKEEMIHAGFLKIEDYSGKIINFEFSSPFNEEITFYLNEAIVKDKIYIINVPELTDCAGNRNLNIKFKAALAASLSPEKLIINEILFNPPSGGSDYLEIYNRSSSTFDLSRLYIAGRTPSGEIQQIRKLTDKTILLFPGEFRLITPDIDFVVSWYNVKDDPQIFLNSPLPSLPDDKGTILLLGENGIIIDELSYSNKWHHPLIKDENGVSLERINSEVSTSNKDNWTSASAAFGYGTPGFRNSQHRNENQIKGTLEALPEIFSPNGDGYEDLLIIRYKLNKPNSSGSITITDRSGIIVKHILRNGILGNNGFFHWNGLNDKNQELPAGVYIIIFSIISPDGSSDKMYKPIVLVR